MVKSAGLNNQPVRGLGSNHTAAKIHFCSDSMRKRPNIRYCVANEIPFKNTTVAVAIAVAA